MLVVTCGCWEVAAALCVHNLTPLPLLCFLQVSHGGKGGTSATDAAGGSQKRARLQQSSDDKGRAAYASGRQLSVVDGLASDHDCEVLIIAG